MKFKEFVQSLPESNVIDFNAHAAKRGRPVFEPPTMSDKERRALTETEIDNVLEQARNSMPQSIKNAAGGGIDPFMALSLSQVKIGLRPGQVEPARRVAEVVAKDPEKYREWAIELYNKLVPHSKNGKSLGLDQSVAGAERSASYRKLNTMIVDLHLFLNPTGQ